MFIGLNEVYSLRYFAILRLILIKYLLRFKFMNECVLFMFLLFSLESFSQTDEKNNKELNNYYKKFGAEAILFDSLNYPEDCLYRLDTAIFSGYAVRKYSDKKESFCHIKNGKIDTAILLDSEIKNIKEASLFFPNFERKDFWFYDNGKTQMMIHHRLDDGCDSAFKHQIQSVFGTTPDYLHLKSFYPSGKLKCEKVYDTISPMRSESRFYYENGKMFAFAKYEKGHRVGKWKMYHKSGIRVGFIKWKDEKIERARWYDFDSKDYCYKKYRVKNYIRNKPEECSKFKGIGEAIHYY